MQTISTIKILHLDTNHPLLWEQLKKEGFQNEADYTSTKEAVESKIENYHGIIISDFVYGVITPKIIDKIFDISKTKNIKVFGDVQCSSQMGDVTKFKNIELITPTEKEARIGLGDQNSSLEVLAHKLIKVTNNNNVVITLGSQGILAYTTNNHADIHSEYFPSLETPVDVAGAGDSVMSGYALGLCHGLNLMEATAFASCLAGISVSRIGNIPIKVDEIKQYLHEIMNIPTSNEE
jgi:bifunctional ADP-heptose synthase (sugar kinase/adenylyltransferase)